jgi:hypothetical protein
MKGHYKPTLEQVIKYLLGEIALFGFWFGERPKDEGPFWWRDHLRQAFEASPSEAVGRWMPLPPYEQEKPMTPREIVDYLTYQSYAHNRLIAPHISVQRWEKVWGPGVWELEAQFQRDKENSHDDQGSSNS